VIAIPPLESIAKEENKNHLHEIDFFDFNSMQKTNDITVNSIPRRRVKERGSWYITADTVTGNSILKFTNITVRDTFPIERALVYDS
jgi:hypothetical protein